MSIKDKECNSVQPCLLADFSHKSLISHTKKLLVIPDDEDDSKVAYLLSLNLLRDLAPVILLLSTPWTL